MRTKTMLAFWLAATVPLGCLAAQGTITIHVDRPTVALLVLQSGWVSAQVPPGGVLLARADGMEKSGKEIKVTEHDIDLDQREAQADYTRDFLTLLFSHPVG